MNKDTSPAWDRVEQWMREHGDALTRAIVLLTGDEELAQEIAQETFILAYRSADRFRGDSSAYTYLYRIALNLVRSWYRRAWNRTAFHEYTESVSPDPGPDERLERDGTCRAVRKAVLALPPRFRETAVLHYFADMPIKDIARVVGVSEGTVKSRLHRARTRLEHSLAQEVSNYA